MQRSKREDYRAEEEHRMQKVKYEESAEDVQRRMQDIIEAENDNVGDMYTFLEAELDYHDRCREILLQVKHSWPSRYATFLSLQIMSLEELTICPAHHPPSLNLASHNAPAQTL